MQPVTTTQGLVRAEAPAPCVSVEGARHASVGGSDCRVVPPHFGNVWSGRKGSARRLLPMTPVSLQSGVLLTKCGAGGSKYHGSTAGLYEAGSERQRRTGASPRGASRMNQPAPPRGPLSCGPGPAASGAATGTTREVATEAPVAAAGLSGAPRGAPLAASSPHVARDDGCSRKCGAAAAQLLELLGAGLRLRGDATSRPRNSGQMREASWHPRALEPGLRCR